MTDNIHITRFCNVFVTKYDDRCDYKEIFDNVLKSYTDLHFYHLF